MESKRIFHYDTKKDKKDLMESRISTLPKNGEGGVESECPAKDCGNVLYVLKIMYK